MVQYSGVDPTYPEAAGAGGSAANDGDDRVVGSDRSGPEPASNAVRVAW